MRQPGNALVSTTVLDKRSYCSICNIRHRCTQNEGFQQVVLVTVVGFGYVAGQEVIGKFNCAYVCVKACRPARQVSHRMYSTAWQGLYASSVGGSCCAGSNRNAPSYSSATPTLQSPDEPDAQTYLCCRTDGMIPS